MRGSNAARRTGMLATVALHAMVLAAMLSYAPARTALLAAAPVMVDLLVPPKVEPKPVAPIEIPPQPKPVAKKRPPHPRPMLTVPQHAPEPILAPAPPPPPPVAQPAPEPTPVAAPPVAATAPIFNADYLDNPAPAYPSLSRRLGEQGRVLLRVLVSAAGTAQEIQVRTSSGFARLDESARNTVQGWKFVPARRGSEPVAAWVLIPVSFRLES